MLGIARSRVSQVKAGEPFPRETLHQEVSVSPASALGACAGFEVGAAPSLQLGLVLVLGSVRWEVAPALSRGMGPAFKSSMVHRAKEQCLKRSVGELRLLFGFSNRSGVCPHLWKFWFHSKPN